MMCFVTPSRSTAIVGLHRPGLYTLLFCIPYCRLLIFFKPIFSTDLYPNCLQKLSADNTHI